MVSVKSLSELTIAPDGCFAFVDSTQKVSINYDSPSGKVEYTDFEAFSHPNGTILRFGSCAFDGPTPWSLNVVLDDKVTILQWPTYEEDYDTWENIERTQHSFIAFMRSADMGAHNKNSTLIDPETRCDNNGYGPLPYSTTDGIKPTVMDFNFAAKMTAGRDTRPIISVNGSFHINTMYAHGINQSWRNWPMVTLVAKTLSGAIRQLAAWKDLYLAGISTDDFARDADYFFEVFGITDSMIEELKETEVVMPTERFFLGYGNPRHGFTETGVLPDSIKNQLTKNIRYRTLSVLEKKHPSKPAISSILKEQERSVQLKKILKWFYMFKPSVPQDEMSTELILGDLHNNDRGRHIISPISANSQIHSDGIHAARFFDATK